MFFVFILEFFWTNSVEGLTFLCYSQLFIFSSAVWNFLPNLTNKNSSLLYCINYNQFLITTSLMESFLVITL